MVAVTLARVGNLLDPLLQFLLLQLGISDGSVEIFHQRLLCEKRQILNM